MQIRKFINMEPPDAAVPRVYSFHLRDARVSSPFRIHLYSATFIIAPLSLIPRLFSPEAKTHTAVVVLLARRDGEATMCRLWGYQCVPFIVLRRRDFYTKCFPPRRALPSHSDAGAEIFFASSPGRKSEREIRHHLAATFEHMRNRQ